MNLIYWYLHSVCTQCAPCVWREAKGREREMSDWLDYIVRVSAVHILPFHNVSHGTCATRRSHPAILIEWNTKGNLWVDPRSVVFTDANIGPLQSTKSYLFCMRLDFARKYFALASLFVYLRQRVCVCVYDENVWSISNGFEFFFVFSFSSVPYSLAHFWCRAISTAILFFIEQRTGTRMEVADNIRCG